MINLIIGKSILMHLPCLFEPRRGYIYRSHYIFCGSRLKGYFSLINSEYLTLFVEIQYSS